MPLSCGKSYLDKANSANDRRPFYAEAMKYYKKAKIYATDGKQKSKAENKIKKIQLYLDYNKSIEDRKK